MRISKVIFRFTLFVVMLFFVYSVDMPHAAATLQAPTPEPTSAKDSTQKKVVYLTFDDGPCDRTPELLKALEEADVKATFFLIGRMIKDYPDAVRDIAAKGHVIGSHSFYHERSNLKTFSGFERNMKLFNDALSEALGKPMDVHLIRFPFGSSWLPKALLKQIAESGYLWIDWNANNGDTIDTIRHDVQKMLQTAIDTSGDANEVVLLMHEDNGRTIKMLPDIIQYYRNQGYTFDVLSTSIDHFIPFMHMGLPGNPKVR